MLMTVNALQYTAEEEFFQSNINFYTGKIGFIIKNVIYYVNVFIHHSMKRI